MTRLNRKKELVVVNGRRTRGTRYLATLKPLRSEDGQVLYDEGDPAEPLLPEIDEPRRA